MSIIAAPAAVFSTSGNKTLYQIISGLGLTTNLKLCLDAGDANSYNPAVQTAKWLDTSGNGYDFYRGTSGVGDGAEPTFNGSAGGLSSAEYFSFDGGDYFLYDSANETWMNSLHKDGVQCTVFAVFYPASITTLHRLFMERNVGGFPGFSFLIDAVARPTLLVTNDSTTAMSVPFAATLTNNAWHNIQISWAENAGAGNYILNLDGAAETSSATITSPSSVDHSASPAIGAATTGANPLTSGSRLACLAIWQGTALSSANLTALYDAIKGRFGL